MAVAFRRPLSWSKHPPVQIRRLCCSPIGQNGFNREIVPRTSCHPTRSMANAPQSEPRCYPHRACFLGSPSPLAIRICQNPGRCFQPGSWLCGPIRALRPKTLHSEQRRADPKMPRAPTAPLPNKTTELSLFSANNTWLRDKRGRTRKTTSKRKVELPKIKSPLTPAPSSWFSNDDALCPSRHHVAPPNLLTIRVRGYRK